MAEFFQNKYRIASARLQSWNYANDGMYFVTICTKNRQCYFGEIVNLPVETQCIASLQQQPTLNPTEIGKIARDEWFKTPELRPDMNLELGEFIVMPNHIHGIILIGKNEYNRRDAMHGSLRRIPIKSNIKTNLHRNPKILHQLFVDINLP
ncbi:MAG: hypothetical protein J7502_11205 [Flavisolibacter sp.]|nr:hypothetical protein [Flavisolibacter sp.]